MTDFPRYAIYFVPAPDSDLYRFGAGMLGYDAFSGEDLPFPDSIVDAVPDWHDLTHDPRKYGFHATLKAPFSLTPDKTEAELFAACSNFAATPRTIPVIKPVVGSMQVHPGELTTVTYEIANQQNRPMQAQAIPSYIPAAATQYFRKVECFCFTAIHSANQRCL